MRTKAAIIFFFFKQKTAYEMRISDWSSDVCSSDLPVPAFDLPGALPGRAGLKTADLQSGQPVLLNVFASWCVPCAAEAPQLLALKRQGVVIHAIALRDTGAAVGAFLARRGAPFAKIGFDDRRRVQIYRKSVFAGKSVLERVEF